MSEFLKDLFDEIETQTGGGEKELTVKIDGEEDEPFYIDGQGEANRSVSKRGLGLTFEFTAIILNPAGEYQIQVTTNGEGGLDWSTVSDGQPINFTIKTRGGLSKTDVDVNLKSNLRNMPGLVRIAYKSV